jgi:hypothetical protein
MIKYRSYPAALDLPTLCFIDAAQARAMQNSCARAIPMAESLGIFCGMRIMGLFRRFLCDEFWQSVLAFQNRELFTA